MPAATLLHHVQFEHAGPERRQCRRFVAANHDAVNFETHDVTISEPFGGQKSTPGSVNRYYSQGTDRVELYAKDDPD